MGIVLLRARMKHGWKMTRGRQGKRKKRGITMKWQGTKHNDPVYQGTLEYRPMLHHIKKDGAVP